MTTATEPNTISEFLMLPKESLPSAEYVSGGIPGLVGAWEALRLSLRRSDREEMADVIAGEIRLTADREGWRDGIVVSI